MHVCPIINSYILSNAFISGRRTTKSEVIFGSLAGEGMHYGSHSTSILGAQSVGVSCDIIRKLTIFGRYFEGLWQLGLLAEASGNLVREWRGAGLPLSAGMGCAVAFTCPCGHPKIHGNRTSVDYSSNCSL